MGESLKWAASSALIQFLGAGQPSRLIRSLAINIQGTPGKGRLQPIARPARQATVLEPFGGSGTTLIAAEKAKRKSFLIEKNPLYCDMIIKR